MTRTTGHSAKGITAIELLITAGVVAVLVAFAGPLVSSMMFNSDLEQAIEITESSVQKARDTARLYQTDVLMSLEMDEQKKLQSIVLSIPAMQRDLTLNEVKEDIALPFGFQAFIDGEIIHFGPTGEVKSPVAVTVVSNQTEKTSQRLIID